MLVKSLFTLLSNIIKSKLGFTISALAITSIVLLSYQNCARVKYKEFGSTEGRLTDNNNVGNVQIDPNIPNPPPPVGNNGSSSSSTLTTNTPRAERCSDRERSCETANGFGLSVCNDTPNGIALGVCIENRCKQNYSFINNKCVPTVCRTGQTMACPVIHGTGVQTCTNNLWSQCNVTCSKGYFLDVSKNNCEALYAKLSIKNQDKETLINLNADQSYKVIGEHSPNVNVTAAGVKLELVSGKCEADANKSLPISSFKFNTSQTSVIGENEFKITDTIYKSFSGCLLKASFIGKPTDGSSDLDAYLKFEVGCKPGSTISNSKLCSKDQVRVCKANGDYVCESSSTTTSSTTTSTIRPTTTTIRPTTIRPTTTTTTVNNPQSLLRISANGSDSKLLLGDNGSTPVSIAVQAPSNMKFADFGGLQLQYVSGSCIGDHFPSNIKASPYNISSVRLKSGANNWYVTPLDVHQFVGCNLKLVANGTIGSTKHSDAIEDVQFKCTPNALITTLADPVCSKAGGKLRCNSSGNKILCEGMKVSTTSTQSP